MSRQIFLATHVIFEPHEKFCLWALMIVVINMSVATYQFLEFGKKSTICVKKIVMINQSLQVIM